MGRGQDRQRGGTMKDRPERVHQRRHSGDSTAPKSTTFFGSNFAPLFRQQAHRCDAQAQFNERNSRRSLRAPASRTSGGRNDTNGHKFNQDPSGFKFGPGSTKFGPGGQAQG